MQKFTLAMNHTRLGITVSKSVSLTIFGPCIAIQYFLYYAPAVLERGIRNFLWSAKAQVFEMVPKEMSVGVNK